MLNTKLGFTQREIHNRKRRDFRRKASGQAFRHPRRVQCVAGGALNNLRLH